MDPQVVPASLGDRACCLQTTAPSERSTANFKPVSNVILFDDVTTEGASVMQAVRARGATVKNIITLVDRLEGATENLRKEGIELVALYTTRDLLG